MKTTYTLDLGDLGEHEVTVYYDFSPPTRPTSYDRNGDPGDPGDPGALEVFRVVPDFSSGLIADVLQESESFYIHVAELWEEGAAERRVCRREYEREERMAA